MATQTCCPQGATAHSPKQGCVAEAMQSCLALKTEPLDDQRCTSAFGPDSEGLGSSGAVIDGRAVAATEVEKVSDRIVDGQEALNLTG